MTYPLNRHGTRLEIGTTEDILELDRAEANRFRPRTDSSSLPGAPLQHDMSRGEGGSVSPPAEWSTRQGTPPSRRANAPSRSTVTPPPQPAL